MKKIGTVIHYYDKIAVAVVLLNDKLEVGDKIKFTRGGEELFDEIVESMQIDHKQVKSGKNGDEVAIETKEKVRDGAEVYLL